MKYYRPAYAKASADKAMYYMIVLQVNIELGLARPQDNMRPLILNSILLLKIQIAHLEKYKFLNRADFH